MNNFFFKKFKTYRDKVTPLDGVFMEDWGGGDKAPPFNPPEATATEAAICICSLLEAAKSILFLTNSLADSGLVLLSSTSGGSL